MRVLIVGRTIPEKVTGSMGLFEFGQAKALREQGENEIIYGFVDNRSIKVLRKIGVYNSKVNGVPVHGCFLPTGGLYKKAYDEIKFILFKKLFKKIEAKYGSIDIVHFHFPILTANFLITKFLKKRKIRICVTEHWSKVQNQELSNREKNILKNVVDCSEKVISVSLDLKNSIIKYCPKAEKKIVIIPNLIDSQYKKCSREKNNIYTFASIGRIVSNKSNIEIIIAFSNFIRKHPDSRLLIIGDGNQLSVLKKYVTKNNLENSVFFLGFLTPKEIMLKYKLIDTYVSASEFETFGVPVIETWMMGRPVIIRDNHPLRSYVTDDNGVLFTKKSLYESMELIYKKNYDSKKISQNANELFSRKKILEAISMIYRKGS